jgi:hypothetical protein
MGVGLKGQALRALVFVLLLPLAFSAGLPTLARVLHGPATHVCCCEVRGGHSTCACPVCHPDREDLALSEESLRGRCGDEDVAFGAALGFAVIAPALHVPAAPLVGPLLSRAPPREKLCFAPEPNTPPPRSLAV